MEDGHVEVGVVADLPELLREARLVPRVEDPVALDDEPAAHNVLLARALLNNSREEWPVSSLEEQFVTTSFVHDIHYEDETID